MFYCYFDHRSCFFLKGFIVFLSSGVGFSSGFIVFLSSGVEFTLVLLLLLSSSPSLLSCPYRFLLKNQKVAPEISGYSLLNFPYCFVLQTIRKVLPRAQDPPSSIFLIVSYLQNEENNIKKNTYGGRSMHTCRFN